MRSKRIPLTRYLVLYLISSLSFYSVAAADDEPLWEELRQRVKSPVFNVGALLQVVGTYENDVTTTPRNGFVLANARLKVRGELDRGWGYYMQVSFIRSPAILDANITFAPWRPLAQFQLGSMKAPFSAEFLTSTGRTDFVRRAQIVTALAPGRQVGLKIGGQSEMGLGYALGAYNGNGLSISNDNNDLMTVGRIIFERSDDRKNQSIQAGVNAYHSNDDDAPIGVPITGDFIAEGFTGERLIGGVDIRLTMKSWFASSEFLAGRFDPRGGSRAEPWGYYVTAGYRPSLAVQILGRWDSFRPDGVLEDSDQVILGLNYWPSSPTEIQTNVVIPTIGDRNVRLIMNVQVIF